MKSCILVVICSLACLLVEKISKFRRANYIYSPVIRTNVHLQHQWPRTFAQTIAANIRVVRVSVNTQANIKCSPAIEAYKLYSKLQQQVFLPFFAIFPLISTSTCLSPIHGTHFTSFPIHSCVYLLNRSSVRVQKLYLISYVFGAFGVLTLLVAHQEEHRACRNWVLRCGCGYLSQATCRLFAYGPADATAFPKPRRILPNLNRDWFYLSGTGLLRLLNECSGSTSRFMPLTVIIIIISFSSITHSLFHSRLKTFLFCKSFTLQPFFFFFRTDYMRDSLDFYCHFWAYPFFYFLVVGSVR